MVLGILSAVLAVSRLTNVVPQSAAQARIRDEWDKEVHAHEALRTELQHQKAVWEQEVEWDKEIQAHEALRAELQHQKAEWERERLAQVQRRQEEEVEWDQAREALRADWARKRDEVEALRADLQREKAEWMRQRAEEKRRKEDERARERAGFRWEDLMPDQRCLRHNARGYTARLAKVPRSYDPIQACEETAIVIPGVEIKGRPVKCEDRGCSGVFGHWIAESGESICATYFKHFDDKGCTSPGSRRRRIQSRLENLQFGDDGRKMCSTTPATFRHQHFPKPDMCDVGIFGVWGVWEIKDQKC
ncbi:hypothetical protein GGX14DRAFT_462057 [Mycena pura]|uniref:Uncharacterized protein n=1 Tax=Mycena pura TaxID=153505 RepID=A0AAD6V926_9AGAR|nr:hypothetical protein GGX14DRAFT_462057 [Mycena pura]